MLFVSNYLLRLAPPLLVLLSVIGFIHRQDSNRLQLLPAFCIGCGLSVSGVVARRQKRFFILTSLKKTEKEDRSSS